MSFHRESNGVLKTCEQKLNPCPEYIHCNNLPDETSIRTSAEVASRNKYNIVGDKREIDTKTGTKPQLPISCPSGAMHVAVKLRLDLFCFYFVNHIYMLITCINILILERMSEFLKN